MKNPKSREFVALCHRREGGTTSELLSLWQRVHKFETLSPGDEYQYYGVPLDSNNQEPLFPARAKPNRVSVSFPRGSNRLWILFLNFSPPKAGS